jgi:uncharacterized membrane protein YagU involved in acid resistance
MASGAVGGCAGTVTMTAAMLGMQQMLPKREQYPLPPRRIVDRIAGMFGARRSLDRTQLNALTAVAHFAYGTGAGAVYGPIGLALPLPRVVSGIAYGLVVWTASYLGLLPALGILGPATQHPARRNALMIAAHMVWGATLGVVGSRVAGWIERR